MEIGWSILELFGHRRLAGWVTEVEIAGGKMLRVDVPAADPASTPAVTQFYGVAAIYCLTPTTEPVARQLAARNQPAPVTPWELRPALPAAGVVTEPPEDEYDDDDEDS